MRNNKRSTSSSNNKLSAIRIIGGSLRGRKITFSEYAEENALRPTSDRIRETLFNWLSSIVIDAECLDAFGGSGALGFEAISRGAKHVTLIEKCAHTLKNIQQNAERFSLPPAQFSCLCEDTLHYLANTSQTFDLIFLDPPFQGNLLIQSIDYIGSRNLLRPNGYIYLESNSPIPSENIPPQWIQHRAKKAGSVYYELYTVSRRALFPTGIEGHPACFFEP